MSTAVPRSAVPQVIEADRAYSQAEFCKRTAMGRATWRRVKLQGLKVRKVGTRQYVLGSDWLSFLESQDTA